MNTPSIYPDAEAGSDNVYKISNENNLIKSNDDSEWLDERSGLWFLFENTTSPRNTMSSFVFDFEGTEEDVDKFADVIENECEEIKQINYDCSFSEEIRSREIKVVFVDSCSKEVKEIITKFGGKNLR